MREHGVQALLMGGQACVLFGAAEFSPDAEFGELQGSRGDAEAPRTTDKSITQRAQRELQATENPFAVLPLCLCVSV
jgi:hypothetical protein